MKILAGRKSLTVTLASLILLAGLYGFPHSTLKPYQDNTGESSSYLAPPEWQINQTDCSFPQNSPEIRPSRTSVKFINRVESISCFSPRNPFSGYDEVFLLIDGINPSFKLIGEQAYQHMDIPPPASTSL